MQLEAVLEEVVRAHLPDLPLRIPDLARRILPAVMRLSEGLTRARPLIGTDYFADQHLALAYFLYYVPANAYRTELLLRNLVRAGIFSASPRIQVLDLGSGPGSQLGALAATFCAKLEPLSDVRPAISGSLNGILPSWSNVSNREIRYEAYDRSDSALLWLRRLASVLKRECRLENVLLEADIRIGDIRKVQSKLEKVDLVLIGNVLNEVTSKADLSLVAAVAWFRSLFDQLRPQAVVVILEPALQLTSHWLEAFREQVRDWPELRILSPCTHRRPCPLLQSPEGKKHWCHQEASWERPSIVEAVDNLSGLRKSTVTFSHLVLQKTSEKPEKSPRSWRALGPALRSPGMTSVHLCGEEGFLEVQRLNKCSSEANRAWSEIRRGDRVHLEPLQQQGQCVRVGCETDVMIEPLVIPT